MPVQQISVVATGRETSSKSAPRSKLDKNEGGKAPGKSGSRSSNVSKASNSAKKASQTPAAPSTQDICSPGKLAPVEKDTSVKVQAPQKRQEDTSVKVQTPQKRQEDTSVKVQTPQKKQEAASGKVGPSAPATPQKKQVKRRHHRKTSSSASADAAKQSPPPPGVGSDHSPEKKVEKKRVVRTPGGVRRERQLPTRAQDWEDSSTEDDGGEAWTEARSWSKEKARRGGRLRSETGGDERVKDGVRDEVRDEVKDEVMDEVKDEVKDEAMDEVTMDQVMELQSVCSQEGSEEEEEKAPPENGQAEGEGGLKQRGSASSSGGSSSASGKRGGGAQRAAAEERESSHGADGEMEHGTDGERDHGDDGEREDGADGEREDATDGEREDGTDGEREQAADGEREDGTDGEREQAADGERDHGTDGERDHGTDGERDHGTDGEREDGTDGEREQRVEGSSSSSPAPPAEEGEELITKRYQETGAGGGDMAAPAPQNNDDHVHFGENGGTTFPCSDDSEVEVCKICHCEGEEDYPLITPCHCTGSLRFVHQDCLNQWIKSSDTRCCELCKYDFIMETQLKPLRKWEKLQMSTSERRKIYCSVLFHLIAISCVLWSIFVLVKRTTDEIRVGRNEDLMRISLANYKYHEKGVLDWPFWTKLIVVAIGFTSGLIFMYIQCKVYLQLWRRLKAFNRIITVQNCPPRVSTLAAATLANGKHHEAAVEVPLAPLHAPAPDTHTTDSEYSVEAALAPAQTPV